MATYEEKRADNIRRNQELLQSLALPTLPVAVPQPAARKRSAPKTRDTTADQPLEKRRSLRVAKLEPDGATASLVKDPVQGAEYSERPRREGALPLEFVDIASEEATAFTGVLTAAARGVPGLGAASGASRYSFDAMAKAAVAGSTHVPKLHVGTAGRKMTKERIYSLNFHPTAQSDTLLLCAGDKMGVLSFLDASSALTRGGGTDPDETDVGVFRTHPHAKPISAIRFDAAGASPGMSVFCVGVFATTVWAPVLSSRHDE